MEKFENDYVIIWIKDGILYCRYKKNTVMDLPASQQIVKDRLEFTKGKSYYMLVDLTNLKSTTKESRDYMRDPDGGLKGLLGGAFLSYNVVTTLFINLFLKIYKPALPAKFFHNKTDAIKWLKKLKTKSKQIIISDKNEFNRVSVNTM